MLDMTNVNPGYAFGEFAKAYATATEHEDPAARERAQRRMEGWSTVISGMASGMLRIGSRTPARDLPAWVTPQVLRGGFATGKPAAAGPSQPHERELCARAGIPATRRALFDHLISEDGLHELEALLQSRRYDVRLPEEAALLTLVWLVRRGDAQAAMTLALELAPFADRLRFLPPACDGPRPEPPVVFREPVAVAGETLAERDEHPRVARMNATLAIWNPLADELLELWLQTRGDDGVVAMVWPDGWHARAAAIVARYDELCTTLRPPRRWRDPKENLHTLLVAARWVARGKRLDPETHAFLHHACRAMVAKRGAPGSPEHTALRAEQAAVAALPMHHELAKVVVARLAALPQSRGLPEPGDVLGPVREDEAAAAGIAAGTPLPASVARVVGRTLEGTPEKLVDAGVIGSAEVLAELVPRIAATTVASAYPDPDLQALIAANYEAFRRRRGLLLLNLSHQVRVDELPWVRAVAPYRQTSDTTLAASRAALARLTELALTAFPATILPSPLVTELASLAREARLDLPFVEELAADIFMGAFTPKFLRAAQHAAQVLQGSPYERYYDVDYAAIAALPAPDGRRTRNAPQPFDELCFSRAGSARGGGWSVAANGKVIEQSQILTTHNLAILTGPFGVGELLRLDFEALARRAWEQVLRLGGRIDANPRPLRTIKDLAYAWRQALFLLSRLDATAQAAVLEAMRADLERSAARVAARLRPVVDGLAHVLDGGRFDPGGRAGDAYRLLGWTTERHPLLGPAASRPGT